MIPGLREFVKLIVLDGITDAEIERQVKGIENRFTIIHSKEDMLAPQAIGGSTKYVPPMLARGKGKLTKRLVINQGNFTCNSNNYKTS